MEILPKKIRKTENIKEYFKKYYRDNLERLRDYNASRKAIMMHCELCDCYLVKKHKIQHFKTAKHIKNTQVLSTQPNII